MRRDGAPAGPALANRVLISAARSARFWSGKPGFAPKPVKRPRAALRFPGWPSRPFSGGPGFRRRH